MNSSEFSLLSLQIVTKSIKILETAESNQDFFDESVNYVSVPLLYATCARVFFLFCFVH